MDTTGKTLVASAVMTLTVLGAFALGVSFDGAQANVMTQGHTPMTICHNGHEITVDTAAGMHFQHLNHGDTLGTCPVAVAPGKSGEVHGNAPKVDDPNPGECDLNSKAGC